MRQIDSKTIAEAAEKLIVQACFELPNIVQEKLEQLEKLETETAAKFTLQKILNNAKVAKKQKLPLCQDTGTAIWFIEIGHQVELSEPLENILQQATATAYQKHHLRASQVKDPIFDRSNTGDNTPAIIHLRQVAGDKLKLTFLPKGGGADNKSQLTMLRPADGKQGVIDFVVKVAKEAGGSSCPPWILGIGIGGSFDTVASLAKEAIIINPSDTLYQGGKYLKLAEEITNEVNQLKIGTLGFGGTQTILATKIKVAPCHIASLPVAVNIQCHSARVAKCVI